MYRHSLCERAPPTRPPPGDENAHNDAVSDKDAHQEPLKKKWVVSSSRERVHRARLPVRFPLCHPSATTRTVRTDPNSSLPPSEPSGRGLKSMCYPNHGFLARAEVYSPACGALTEPPRQVTSLQRQPLASQSLYTHNTRHRGAFHPVTRSGAVALPSRISFSHVRHVVCAR